MVTMAWQYCYLIPYSYCPILLFQYCNIESCTGYASWLNSLWDILKLDGGDQTYHPIILTILHNLGKVYFILNLMKFKYMPLPAQHLGMCNI